MSDTPLGKAFLTMNKALDSKVADMVGLRKYLEKATYSATYGSVAMSSKASRAFKKVNGLGKKQRPKRKPATDLFDLNYTEEQQMIQATIQQFVQANFRKQEEAANDKCKLPLDMVYQFDELGLNYYAIPEDLGGAMTEKSTVTQMIITEELAYGDLGIAVGLLSPLGFLNAIVEWGTADQQAKYIPTFLEEEQKLFATIAMNEGQAIFDPFDLKCEAKKDGDHYVLNGTKTMVPLAKKSELFLVAANTENGSQLFIVESGMKGVKVQSDPLMGLRPAETGKVTLNDVRIPKENLLGDGVDFNQFIQHVQLAWCALAVGTCQAVLNYVIEYCNNRVAFGEPITHRQAVAFMIADMKIELDGMRLLLQRAASQIEQGKDAQKATYLAVVSCREYAMKIGNDGVQLLGGHGFVRDFPVERWYRDLRAVSLCYNGLHL